MVTATEDTCQPWRLEKRGRCLELYASLRCSASRCDDGGLQPSPGPPDLMTGRASRRAGAAQFDGRDARGRSPGHPPSTARQTARQLGKPPPEGGREMQPGVEFGEDAGEGHLAGRSDRRVIDEQHHRLSWVATSSVRDWNQKLGYHHRDRAPPVPEGSPGSAETLGHVSGMD